MAEQQHLENSPQFEEFDCYISASHYRGLVPRPQPHPTPPRRRGAVVKGVERFATIVLVNI